MIGVNPQYVTTLAASLDGISAAEQRFSAEVSSGVRVSSIGEDALASGQNTRLTDRMAEDATFTQTASTVESRMQVADSALGSVVSQLTQAISVATQGTSGTANRSNLDAITQQLSGIRDEVLSLANTSYMGTYLFAGSQGNTQPFSLDASTSPASVTYNGDATASTVQTPSGQTIQTSLAGSQIFNAPGNGVLQTLNSLIAKFSAGDATGAAADIGLLSGALSYVSTQRAVLGGSLGRLQAAGTYAQTEQTQLLSAQTNLMQADLPQVATSLSLAETQQSALEAVIASLEKQGNLFSMLQ